jgi:hypothetical protein
MGAFSKLPSLKTGLITAFREVMALPFFVYFFLINGDTCLYIRDDLSIEFRDGKRTEVEIENGAGQLESVEGMIVGQEFIPADGHNSFFKMRFLGTEFLLAFEDFEALTNPGTLAIEDGDVATVPQGEHSILVADGHGSRLKKVLTVPLLKLALLLQGSTAVVLDEDRRIRFKGAKTVDDPREGIVVGSDFKDNRGPATSFTNMSVNVFIAWDEHESLINPAAPEMLRAMDEAEEEGELVGPKDRTLTPEDVPDHLATDGGTIQTKPGVRCRKTTGINLGRLAEYAPFSMKRGTDTRQTMNFAWEARSKHEDSSNALMYVGMVMAFFVGALSPRLSGTGGGGGGGGGFAMPVPQLAPPDLGLKAIEIVPSIIDVTVAGVL